MKICQYRSPLGRFLVKPQANGRWGLWLKDGLLGSCRSAMAAGDDVCMQATGDCDWDSLDGVDVPTDISEWEAAAR